MLVDFNHNDSVGAYLEHPKDLRSSGSAQHSSNSAGIKLVSGYTSSGAACANGDISVLAIVCYSRSAVILNDKKLIGSSNTSAVIFCVMLTEPG